MDSEITLILDKNLNGALSKALEGLGFDTIHSGGVIPEETPDMRFVQISTELERTIVTSDQQFHQPDTDEDKRILDEEFDGELSGHPGIIIVPKDEDLAGVSYAELAEAISRVISQYGVAELQGSVIRAHNWI